MTSRIILATILALASTACLIKKEESNTAAAGDTSSVRERETADGNLVVEVDLDGDDRADIFNYFRKLEGEGRLLLRKEMDLNKDGRIDVWSFFTETGVLEREEMDGDFDGNIDWIDHYQGGKRVMSEIDTQNSGRFDLFKYYESGNIRRKERDTTGDGNVDHWEYFDDEGNVVKVGWDIDGDGQMDVRED
jgi:antitoxin component YwqK of YwqJK toxin-antitoxin module